MAEEIRMSVGMRCSKVIRLITKNSGTDITSGIELNYPKGARPPKGIYWSFEDYDAIITLSEDLNGKIKAMTFWSKSDFRLSKSHRSDTEQNITALIIDTTTQAVSIEKKK